MRRKQKKLRYKYYLKGTKRYPITLKQWKGRLEIAYGLKAPKWFPKLIERYGNNGNEFIKTLESLGFSGNKHQDSIKHFEADWIR